MYTRGLLKSAWHATEVQGMNVSTLKYTTVDTIINIINYIMT